MESKMFTIHSHPLRFQVLLEFKPYFNKHYPADLRHCEACGFDSETDQNYCCDTCGVEFHEECAESSLKITHPYHPRHPLEILPRDDGDMSRICHGCKERVGSHFYHCALCDFNLHLFCASKQPLLEIEPDVKIHEHKLTLWPREADFTCNACGKSGVSFPIYACLPCDFMVHKDCTRFPSVIRISRHEHRVYRAPYLPPRQWFCGICHQQVDARYWAFLCTKDCGYVAHSKCATTRDVWDGKELEGVPEEEDELTGVEPYEVIHDMNPRIIRHFSHGDHLRLVEDSNGCDEGKRCQACILPIYSGNYYHCVEVSCEFILHEECANLPRKRRHQLNTHVLVLLAGDISSDDNGSRGYFRCSTCYRVCFGFRFFNGSGDYRRLTLDVRCASISEPLTHKGHQEHGPLFLKSRQIPRVKCWACKESSGYVLRCLQCDFLLCFKCATLPDTVKYKFDKHPLTLCYGEDANDPYWCEVCEKQMDPKIWFYTCNHCCVTAHVECVLGSSPYATPGLGLRTYYYHEFDIVSNSRIDRPLCHKCDRRCPDAVVFKREDHYFCSTKCCELY